MCARRWRAGSPRSPHTRRAANRRRGHCATPSLGSKPPCRNCATTSGAPTERPPVARRPEHGARRRSGAAPRRARPAEVDRGPNSRGDASSSTRRPERGGADGWRHHQSQSVVRATRDLALVTKRRTQPNRQLALFRRIRSGRCPARTGDLLLVRREQLLRSTAVCRSVRLASHEPHIAAAVCCSLLLPERFHKLASVGSDSVRAPDCMCRRSDDVLREAPGGRVQGSSTR